jgi:endonuclease/exonuclease/phosphatase family metal-dependent hydrolase
MRKYIILVCLAASMIACSTPKELGVMSYNVHNAIGMDKITSYERIAKIISDSKVDVVAVQELDSVTTRSKGVDVLKAIAENCDMYPTFGGSIDFQGGKYGIGILSKEKPLSYYRVPLPCRSEPRSLLVAEFEDYYFCSTHLSLHAEDRLSSAKIIVEELSKLNKPALIAGDFNAQPEEESMLYLSKHMNIYKKGDSPHAENPSPYTFPANKPSTEIDYICSFDPQQKIKLTSHYTKHAPVESDHAPIVAWIEIK